MRWDFDINFVCANINDEGEDMGLFSKSEVVILKETSDAKEYLQKLEMLLPRAQGEIKKKIEYQIAITKAGIQGEEAVLFELKNSGMDLVVIQDIYIETEDGRGAQIDFVVITSKINFFIECKNLVGTIEIDSKGNFKRKVSYGKYVKEEGIYSPITQNERHLQILKECKMENRNWLGNVIINGTFESYNKSLVVLANSKTILKDRYAKKEVKNQVIRVDQLIKIIKEMNKSSKNPSSNKKEMRKIGENLLKRNHAKRKDYCQYYEGLVEELESEQRRIDKEESTIVERGMIGEDTKLEMICPKCGAKLVLRTAKKGNNIGQKFYGCSAFPKCFYTQKIENEIVE